MSYRRPGPLDERHDVSRFDCGEPTLNVWLRDMAMYNQQQNFTRTVVIADADHSVVGYHALCAGMIHRNDVTRSVRGSKAPEDIPVVLLARLAVDERHKKQGLGGDLLRNAMLATISASQSVAFRAIVVDALNDAARQFYLRYGFRETKISPSKLILPAKDIIEALREAAGER